VAKKLIDPRTASKIEVFTNSKSGITRMNELIDETQIPSDYGGSGHALAQSASGVGKACCVGEQRKVVVLNHLFQLTKKQKNQSHQFKVDEGQHMTLKLYTRCHAGVKVELLKGDSERALIAIEVVGGSEVEGEPYSRTIGTLAGSGRYTLKITGRIPGSFLILGIMNVNV
jgi:hypothetical protein